MTPAEKYGLCEKLRKALIEGVSHTGGHLASNLGTVELTVELLDVFDPSEDKIVWDVGHQSYVYKMLTGRADRFPTLRKKGGISGFPYPPESDCDSFIGGHSGTSISAAYGLFKAMRFEGKTGRVVAVIGDGSLGNGEAYEGLNNVGADGETGLIVILNDNGMSISRNVGRMASYLTKIRNRKSYFDFKSGLARFLNHLPLIGKPVLRFLTKIKFAFKYTIYRNSTMFEDLGFTYLGPVNGHSVEELKEILTRAEKIEGPVIVHIKTIKGKGYDKAENDPSLYHGVGSFSVENGADGKQSKCFTSAFSEALLDIAEKDDKICAITAAMKYGTGLQFFHFKYPERFFDVGIAEQHAVTFAGGLASMGMIPVFAVYSTFLQRAYDQLVHDIAIGGLHIVLGIDRAGIVGEDGETHQGLLDVPMLTTIPNTVIYSPSCYSEMKMCMKKALYSEKGLAAVRYPRGSEEMSFSKYHLTTEHLYIREENSDILIITYGRL
ncbi:MAG: 1-deoxy-D-xylulose-5-phosphate synthase, partial [Clostridia bacterium]|nr:1-deoxy-D-xylulose-5-phosphate synthase [Clostridia bacterium]